MKIFFRCVISTFVTALLLLFSQAKAETKMLFKRTKIKIENNYLKVELAENPEQQERGLMYRTELKDGFGMLFVFEDEAPRAFWMKNTFVPLTIGYFDSHKKLINTMDMKAAMSTAQTEFPNYQSAGPAKYALEVPLGWFQKKKIKKDSLVSDANRKQR